MKNFKHAVSDICAVGAPAAAVVEVVKDVANKAGKTLSGSFVTFAGVLPATMVVGFSITAFDKVRDFKDDCKKVLDNTQRKYRMRAAEKSVKTLSELIIAVSYIALGAILLASFATGAVFAPWIALTCSTTALALTIFNKFYDKIVLEVRHRPAYV